MTDGHGMAGRMEGASGIATWCDCGLSFFAYTRYPRWDPERGAAAAQEAIAQADEKWRVHSRDAERPERRN